MQQTQQLLNQAQRIAYNVQQIQTAFSTTYGQASPSASNAALIANAQSRWQNSVAAFQDSLKVQAGVVGNIPGNSSHHDFAGDGQPIRERRVAGRASR